MNGIDVLLTSFLNARKFDTNNKFSVARSKPTWCKYFDLPFLAPFRPSGNPILLRNFFEGDPVECYANALREAYVHRWDVIERWLNDLKQGEFIVLCCWCPHSKSTKKQMADYSTFVCHTTLIGKMIRLHRPDLSIALDDIRDQSSYAAWKSWYYETELVKVISGGQTGADEAGLQAAKAMGLQTGGWMPKGYITQAGNRPDFIDLYGVEEHTSAKYSPRTFTNVRDSDGTIRFARNFESKGEILTLKAITQYKRPYFDIDIDNAPQVVIVREWIRKNKIKVLNIAGNAESRAKGINAFVFDYLTKVFRQG